MKNLAGNGDETIQISFWQLLQSTAAAFIGVQSDANRERDFKHGKVSQFIAIGIIFGLVFVCTIVAVVQIVMLVTGS